MRQTRSADPGDGIVGRGRRALPRARARTAGLALLWLLPLLMAARPAADGDAAGASGFGALHDAPQRSLVLPSPDEAPRDHWVWLGDLLLRRSALIDADSGRYRGTLPGSVGAIVPLPSPDGREIHLASTFYSRAVRGERSDVLTTFDARSLRVIGEIALPPRRADYVGWAQTSALSDDGRFAAVFNLIPATSLSIVDLAERRFAGEIATPGCHLAYPAGARRFAMLCGDGTLQLITLDAQGGEARRTRSPVFFDAQGDPVTEKAVRIGDRWLFVSFEGWLHEVDLSGEAPAFPEPWSLLDDADRAAGWRIGGVQHLAAHEGRGELYSLVHHGGPDTHKQAGEEVWVYDLATHARVRRIAVPNLAAAFVAHTLGREGGAVEWLLDRLVPSVGADHVYVSQDDDPILVLATREVPVAAVLGAADGRVRNVLHDVGFAVNRVSAP